MQHWRAFTTHQQQLIFISPAAKRQEKKIQILTHFYDLNHLHDLRRNSVQNEVPKSESFIVLGCVNSRSHLPRCWECSSFRLSNLIPAKVQTQTSVATKSKSLADPWLWTSRDQHVPKIQILAQAGRDQTNKTSQQKNQCKKTKKQQKKKIPNLRSFNCLEFELPLSPGCISGIIHISMSHSSILLAPAGSWWHFKAAQKCWLYWPKSV